MANQLTTTTKPIEHLSAPQAAQLERHEKNIKTFIKGQRKGAAEQFGYAYLAGCELLSAKDLMPGVNQHRNAGFSEWAEGRFDVEIRTCQRWMQFATAVNAHDTVSPPLSMKLLSNGSNGEIDPQTHPAIVRMVNEIMDGSGMMRLMRDSRLLRDPQKPTFHPRKKGSAQAVRAAKLAQAEKWWERVKADHVLGEPMLNLCSNALLKECLEVFVGTTGKIRELLRAG